MAGRSSEGRPSREEQPPSLDLFNFDRPEHQKSRYILTSPRSLRACAALGIKPVELLPQSQQDLTQVCGDTSPQAMAAIHQELEAQRRVKLQAARKEREKIISRQKSKGCSSYRQSPHLTSSDSPTTRSQSMPPVWNQNGQATPLSGSGLKSTTAATGRGDLDISGLPEKDKRILATLSLRFTSEESQQRERAAVLEERWQQWERRKAQLASRATQQIVEKKNLEDWKRRQQQQQQRRVQEEERELREEMREHSFCLQERAAANRESFVQQRTLEKQFKHSTRQMLHKQRKKELEAVAMEEEEERSRHLEARLSASADRYLLQQALKKEHMRHLAEKEQQKASRRREAAVRMEADLEEWKKELGQFRVESQRRAAETNERVNWEKMWRARSERERHELEHSQTFRRLQVDEEERQKQLEQEVEEKEKKRETLHKEKQLAIEKSREISRASERARQQLKERCLRTTFGWKIQEAEKFNKLHRPRTS